MGRRVGSQGIKHDCTTFDESRLLSSIFKKYCSSFQTDKKVIKTQINKLKFRYLSLQYI